MGNCGMAMFDEQTEVAIELLNDTFIWDFKVGDNIIYNLNILWSLYHARANEKSSNNSLFNKPIILIIISIIECILYDFVERIQKHSFDPLPNLDADVIRDFKYKIKGEKTEIKILKRFNHYIYYSRKHDIFDKGVRFYDALDFLRIIRNRIHIQDDRRELEKDDYNVFTDKRIELAQKVMEVIIFKMITKFPRKWAKQKIDPREFPYPWNYI